MPEPASGGSPGHRAEVWEPEHTHGFHGQSIRIATVPRITVYY